jgi:dihydrofolate reductase
MKLVVIAAVAENGVIGSDGEIPWQYPADLAHFRQTTTGHPVIMGRTTYESIRDRLGEPLPGRTNVVLTRSGLDDRDREEERVTAVGSVDEAVAAARRRDDTAYVAGGATVYEQFLPHADRLLVTEVPESPDGDVTFPEWDADEWVETGRRTEGDLDFVTYERA